MKKKIFLSIFFLITIFCSGQTWEENAYKKNPTATFFDLKESFDNYRYTIPYQKGNGYNPYARTINFLESRVDHNGIFYPNSLWDEWKKINSEKNGGSSNWTPLGPFDVPIILSNNKKRGNGRVNCIEFHPIDPNIFWVGAPGGDAAEGS